MKIRMPKYFEIIETPLFTLYPADEENEYPYFKCNERFIPCLSILSYFKKIDLRVREIVKTIPIRWFTLIKDLYMPDMEITHIQNTHVYILSNVPDITLERILQTETIGHDAELYIREKGWESIIYDTNQTSPVVKSFILKANEFKSLINGQYKVIKEGGIVILNKYVEEYIMLRHTINSESSDITYNNYIDGINKYTTNKDITYEEMAILYMYLKHLNIDCKLKLLH
jgi:hypothetical protein